MAMPPQDYDTFIGGAYPAPIFTLVETLAGGGRTNEVQSSPHEYGYSASAITLTVLFLESYLNVSKLLTNSQHRSVLAYFTTMFTSSKHHAELAELFAVRDVIAHNHVWKGQIDPVAMKWTSISLLPGYGDARFRQVVNGHLDLPSCGRGTCPLMAM